MSKIEQTRTGISRVGFLLAHKIFLDILGYINYNKFMGYIK